eukprot:4142578-Pyramimonas_sp.AAC.1
MLSTPRLSRSKGDLQQQILDTLAHPKPSARVSPVGAGSPVGVGLGFARLQVLLQILDEGVRHLQQILDTLAHPKPTPTPTQVTHGAGGGTFRCDGPHLRGGRAGAAPPRQARQSAA